MGRSFGTGGVGSGQSGGPEGGWLKWNMLRRFRNLLGGDIYSWLEDRAGGVDDADGGGGGGRDGGVSGGLSGIAFGEGISGSEPSVPAADNGKGEEWICMLIGRRRFGVEAESLLMLVSGRAGRAEVGGG